MKIAMIAFLLGAFFSIGLHGAKRQKLTDYTIYEVLKLPVKNRYQSLKFWGKNALPHLRQISFDKKKSMAIRWRALTSLVKLQGKKSVSYLLKASGDSQWYIRNGALIGLAHVDSKRAVELAEALLKDRAMVVRAAAADVLQKYGGKHHRQILWRSLYDSINFRRGQSLWVRKNIARAFLKVSILGDEDRMIKLLNDRDLGLHSVGISGLEKLTKRQFGVEKDSVSNKKNQWVKWWQSRSLKLR